jgi:hypothetical protein
MVGLGCRQMIGTMLTAHREIKLPVAPIDNRVVLRAEAVSLRETCLSS